MLRMVTNLDGTGVSVDGGDGADVTLQALAAENAALRARLDLVESVLGIKTNGQGGVRRWLMPLTIVRVVSEVTMIAQDDILSVDRTSIVVRARQIAAFMMRSHTRLSYQDISKVLHRTDHTTARHHVSRCRALRQKDPGFAEMCFEVEKRLAEIEAEGVCR